MTTKRIPHRIAGGLILTASLVLVLAVQVGSTAAATGTSGASASEAVQGAVTLHLQGPGLGPRNPGGRGRFTISGAVSDHGQFADDLQGEPGRGVRTFYGRKGTIRMTVGHFGFWKITKGTGAYAGLHGRGTGGNLSPGNQGPVEIWMEGTLSR
jgi:hypothetical protein